MEIGWPHDSWYRTDSSSHGFVLSDGDRSVIAEPRRDLSGASSATSLPRVSRSAGGARPLCERMGSVARCVSDEGPLFASPLGEDNEHAFVEGLKRQDRIVQVRF